MLGQIILRNARLFPDAPAIIVEGRTITHREFAARAFRLANALARIGVRRGDRVAVLAQNCPEYMESFAAGELGGLITVTINYRLAAPEVGYILADSRPKVLIAEAPLIERVSAEARSRLDHIITFAGAGPDLDFETILSAEEATPPAAEVRPEDIAYLIYTSGTTGRPKGVMLTHRGQFWCAQATAIGMGVRPVDRVAVAMPLYHIGAKNTSLTRSMQGCAIV